MTTLQTVLQNPFAQVFFAFMGALAYSILFHITRSRLVFAALGGAVSWGVYLALAPVFPGEVLRFFIASALTTVYSEIMARVQKTPTTTYLVPSIIPLIPGGHLYYTMNFAIRGDWEQFSERGLFTLKLALALAAGIIVVTSLTTAAKNLLRHGKTPRTNGKKAS